MMNSDLATRCTAHCWLAAALAAVLASERDERMSVRIIL